MFAALFLFDRAAVVERCGLRCQGCGYDLRGQRVPRCPECGRALDEREQAFLQTGTFPTPSVRRQGLGWVVLVVMILLVSLTLLGVGIKRYRAVRAAAAKRPPTLSTTLPATSAPTTQPNGG